MMNKGMIIGMIVTVVAFLMLANFATKELSEAMDEYSAYEDKIAQCIIEESAKRPLKNNIRQFCKAKVRVE